MTYELVDEVFGRECVSDRDHLLVDSSAWPYEEGESVKPKFDSVAAAVMWCWSLDSSQDEDCGDAQLGNGWHALFRSERAILHTGNSGFVSAWRIADDADMDEKWEEIEKGARYMDDVECPGHYDDDHTLTSGVGIEKATHCDGSCQGD